MAAGVPLHRDSSTVLNRTFVDDGWYGEDLGIEAFLGKQQQDSKALFCAEHPQDPLQHERSPALTV